MIVVPQFEPDSTTFPFRVTTLGGFLDGNASLEDAGRDLSATEATHGDVFLPWDNPWNIISYQTSRTVVDTVAFFVFPWIFVVGVSTNILNCIVFYRQGLTERMNLCLFWLGIVDLSYVLCEAVSAAHSFIAVLDPVFAKEYEVKRHSFVTGLNLSFLYTSGCITVVIAVDRCVCVLLPLKAQFLMSTRTMAGVLLSITLLLQLGFSIFPLTMKAMSVVDERGVTLWFLAPTQGPDKELMYRLFSLVVDTVLQFALPITASSLVALCTVVTVVRLKLALAWRLSTTTTTTTTSASSNISAAQIQQASLTKMLVFISCVYIVCSLPELALALWRRVDYEFGPGGKFSNMFFATHIVAYQVFTVTNSAVNFFVYYWMSSRYRRVLRTLLCRSEEGPVAKTSQRTDSTQAQTSQ